MLTLLSSHLPEPPFPLHMAWHPLLPEGFTWQLFTLFLRFLLSGTIPILSKQTDRFRTPHSNAVLRLQVFFQLLSTTLCFSSFPNSCKELSVCTVPVLSVLILPFACSNQSRLNPETYYKGNVLFLFSLRCQVRIHIGGGQWRPSMAHGIFRQNPTAS